MPKYIVWLSQNKPTNGTTIAAESSFKARKICADAWGKPIGEVIARLISKDDF